MAQLVVKVGKALREKPLVVIAVFLAWVALGVIAMFNSYTDYMMSVKGWQLLPANILSVAEAYVVGAMPQLVQIAFGFVAIEKKNKTAAIVAAGCLLLDMTTDIYFRSLGQVYWAWPLNGILTFIVYTLGSEFLLLAAFENIVEYAPDAWKALGKIIFKMIDVIGD